MKLGLIIAITLFLLLSSSLALLLLFGQNVLAVAECVFVAGAIFVFTSRVSKKMAAWKDNKVKLSLNDVVAVALHHVLMDYWYIYTLPLLVALAAATVAIIRGN
jgi:hypothetical protein